MLADSYLGTTPKWLGHNETTTPSAAAPQPPQPAAAPPVLPAPQQPTQVAEENLAKAEQHLSTGISLLVPLLKYVPDYSEFW
jgi:hypothetical protein